MRLIRSVVAAGLALALFASSASAANVHLKGGANAEPTFTDLGLALAASGALTGLGNADVLITLVATGNVTATCTNPGNGVHQPPGQNPAPVSLSGTQAIPASEIKNGNVDFNVRTASATTPIVGAPDCPNTNWIEDITDVAFTSAVLTVEQPVGTLVFRTTCTFSAPTSNGTVPASNVSCVVG